MPFRVSVRACAVGSQRAQCAPSKTQATTKKRIAIRPRRKRGQFSSCALLMSWQLSQLAALGQWVVVKSESWLDLEILFEKKGPTLTIIPVGSGREILRAANGKFAAHSAFGLNFFLHDVFPGDDQEPSPLPRTRVEVSPERRRPVRA